MEVEAKPKAQAEVAMDEAKTGSTVPENSERFERSNGNQERPSEGKSGSAERGGPGLEKAKSRKPPEATR